MRNPVKNASSAVIPSARREASACSQTSRSSGVRITITCAAPGTGSPGVQVDARGRRRGLGPGSHRRPAQARPPARRASPRRTRRLAAASRPAGRWPYQRTRPRPASAAEHADQLRGPLRRHVPVGRSARPPPHSAAARMTLPRHARPAAVPRWSPSRSTDTAAPAAGCSVTCRMILTSQTCAHDDPASPAPSRGAPHWRALRGRGLCPLLVRVRIPGRPFTGMPGLPARLAVLAPLPLRGTTARALPRLPALPRPRSAPSTAACPNRSCPSAAAAPARRPAVPAAAAAPAHLQVRAHRGKPFRSAASSASLASITARSPAISSRCSPAAPDRSGTSNTSPKLPRPELEVQTPRKPRRVAQPAGSRPSAAYRMLTLVAGLSFRGGLAAGRRPATCWYTGMV